MFAGVPSRTPSASSTSAAPADRAGRTVSSTSSTSATPSRTASSTACIAGDGEVGPGTIREPDHDETEGMPLSGEYEPSTVAWVREEVEHYERTGTGLRGRSVVLLTTVGARTGRLRKTPLMRVEHGGVYALVA